jgi:hypothetical protein
VATAECGTAWRQQLRTPWHAWHTYGVGVYAKCAFHAMALTGPAELSVASSLQPCPRPWGTVGDPCFAMQCMGPTSRLDAMGRFMHKTPGLMHP